MGAQSQRPWNQFIHHLSCQQEATILGLNEAFYYTFGLKE